MIFPVIETEDIIQVGDKTRLSALKSYISPDEAAITKVEIQPEALAGFINVTGGGIPKNWFLDWAYAGASRIVTVSLRITTSVVGPVVQTVTKTMQVVTATDDKLFSADTDLIGLEPDILGFVPVGRSSFLNIHRMAQKKILESLDESGIVGTDRLKLTKAAIVDVSEVSAWSRDLVLHLIFKALINSVDDVFTQKMKFYATEVDKRKARAVLRLDLNGDGNLDKDEGVSVHSMELVRR